MWLEEKETAQQRKERNATSAPEISILLLFFPVCLPAVLLPWKFVGFHPKLQNLLSSSVWGWMLRKKIKETVSTEWFSPCYSLPTEAWRTPEVKGHIQPRALGSYHLETCQQSESHGRVSFTRRPREKYFFFFMWNRLSSSLTGHLPVPSHLISAALAEFFWNVAIWGAGWCVHIPCVSSEVWVSWSTSLWRKIIHTHTHRFCPLTKHTVVEEIPPPRQFGVLKVHTAARGERGDALPSPMLTGRAGFEKMSVEFGKEAEICISLISWKLQ